MQKRIFVSGFAVVFTLLVPSIFLRTKVASQTLHASQLNTPSSSSRRTRWIRKLPDIELFPVDDRIHVNQSGLQPDQFKGVVVSGDLKAATFEIVNENDRTVFSAPLEHFGFDADSREELWRGDFTGFRLLGLYRVKVGDRGFSFPFTISRNVNQRLTVIASRWLYLQRSGIEVVDPITGVKHRMDHKSLALLRDARGVHSNHRVDTSGGWWDAGDYGRYVPPATSTIMSLLYAYHFNPRLFADGSLQIPESGNGIPDLLDEMRWELDWLLKMQRSDGAVHHKTATRDYSEKGPSEDSQTIYLFDVSSQATAQFAGAVSEASIVYRRYDPPFAAQLLNAAERAWLWLQQHPGKYPLGGFKNPDDENGGAYTISGDETAVQLWAAGCLFHATGNDVYGNEFARLWTKRDQSSEIYGLSWSDGYAFGMFAYLNTRGGDPSLKQLIKEVVWKQSRSISRTIEGTGYRVALKGNQPPFGYQWGSTCLALNYATYLLLANEYISHPQFVNGAASQLSWVLGVNSLNKSFITGVGGNPVRSPHHLLSIVRGEAVPGAITEGPNAMSVGGDPVLRSMFKANVPFSKRYADDEGSWATNEPTIDANAAFIAVAARLSR
ncbi:MAG TPA: glycoside hydrolase family 9 protein [Pyrinomonadaceae bacterium]|nr:glycoside hydrolase family 9 protein [Pyrinomonadaceae bacterium]